MLNSVNENFEMAMQSPENKAAYLQQFESIVRGVEVSTFTSLHVLSYSNLEKTDCAAIVNEARVFSAAENI